MFQHAHLRLSRHGTFYLRVVLSGPVAALLGQREVLRSLGTKSPMEAKALGYRLYGNLLPILSSLGRLVAIDPKSIKPKDIKKLIVERMTFPATGGVIVEGIKTSDDPAIAKQELAGLAEVIGTQSRNARSPKEQARLEAEDAALRDLVMSGATSAPPKDPQTLEEATEAYIGFKKSIAPSSKKSYRESLRLLGALAGGMGRRVHSFTAAECRDFNEALEHVPLHANKKGIPLRPSKEIIAAPYPASVATLSATSANQHITNLKTFFDWAIRSGQHAGPNPMLDLPAHTDGTSGAGAELFTEDELRKIFDADKFMAIDKPHVFWGSLLGLFTGARANEIASLELANFIAEDGHRCIAIRHTAKATTKAKITHKAAKQGGGQRTKNVASRRVLPLHPQLWAVGLQDYLDDLASLGATRFLPHLPLDSRGKRERNLSRDFGNYLKLIGVHEPRTKVFHSFRDTASEALGDSHLDDAAADRWTGHTPTSVKGQSYRKAAPTRNAATALDALAFSFLPWQHIRYRKGLWNDYIKTNMVD